MNAKISEKTYIKVAIDSADIATADRTSPYFAAGIARRVFARLVTGTVAQTKIATLEFLQATDDSGTGAKLLGERQTYTAPTGGGTADLSVDVDLDAIDGDNGFTHFAVKVTSDNATAVTGAVALAIGDLTHSLPLE